MDDDIVLSAPLFAGLEAEASEALVATMKAIDFARGDALFHEGEPGDRLYVVREGKIKLGRRSNDGRENLLAVLGPGEMFGELSLFDPGPRTATATVVADASGSRPANSGADSTMSSSTGTPHLSGRALPGSSRWRHRSRLSTDGPTAGQRLDPPSVCPMVGVIRGPERPAARRRPRRGRRPGVR